MADQPEGGAPSAPSSAAAGGGSSAPSISLPKGGGAIRGIGEKLGVDAATGTGSFSIPGDMAAAIATDLWQLTPPATVQWVEFDLMGPNSPLDPGGPRVYDQELADRAIREGRNPFCAQCHGPGGALDPNSEWNRRARERSFVMPSFPTQPTDTEALRQFIQGMAE